MQSLIPSIVRTAEGLAAPPGTDPEERRKRAYVVFALTVLIPVVAFFAVEDLQQGNRVGGTTVLAMLAVLIILLVALPRIRNSLWIFRIGVVATLLVELYELATGGGGGFAFLWFYCGPVLLMTVFGSREGSLWAFVVLAIAASMMLTPLGHAYPPAIAMRFLVTYVLVASLAYGLESSRCRSYLRLATEKAALEDALAQVKTLRGLLPICAACKKVRDDGGYWQEIEEYVGYRSEADFSHGVCPDCAAAIVPELVAELERRKGKA